MTNPLRWPKKGELYLWALNRHRFIVEVTSVHTLMNKSSGRKKLVISYRVTASTGKGRSFRDEPLFPNLFEDWHCVGTIRRGDDDG